MKLLLDANLPPRLVALLQASDVQSSHVEAVGLMTATDSAIFDYALDNDLVVVTADSDFSMMLALRRSSGPSVILLRNVHELDASDLAALVSANLPAVADYLEQGAVVSLSPTSLRWRRLPLVPPDHELLTDC
jgi:predicted nuclease of predicted toxin-antitoxin system